LSRESTGGSPPWWSYSFVFAGQFTNVFGKGLVAWLWDCLLPWVVIALVIGLPLLGIVGLTRLTHRSRESTEISDAPADVTDSSHLKDVPADAVDSSHLQYVLRRVGGLGLTLFVFGAEMLAMALFFASTRESISDFIASVFGVSGGITLASGIVRSRVFYRRAEPDRA